MHAKSSLAKILIATLFFWSLLFFPTLFLHGEPPKSPSDQIKKLITQLGDSNPAKQTEAATALLRLGPDILPLLPSATDQTLTVEQHDRLKTIRAALRDALTQRELAPHLVTFKDVSLFLRDALAELEKQTSIHVEDSRQNKEENPKLKLDLADVPFWQALDAIAKEADLRVNFYQATSRISLVEGPNQAVPVSYTGMFRVVVKRIEVARDLEGENHICQIFLEVAWEPRFRPLFWENAPDTLTVLDAKGNPLKVSDMGTGKLGITRPNVLQVPLRVDAPGRGTEKLGSVKGSLWLVGPSKLLSFTFANLSPIPRGKPDKEQKQTQEGVSVRVRELSVEDDRWTIGLMIEYPPETPELESFESWLVNNEIFLEKKVGKSRIPANGGSEIDEQQGRQALMNYRFIEDNDVVLGKPADWKLLYKTPGTIVRVAVPFEFKDLPLP